MPDAKTVADLVTISRGMLGLVITWLGLTKGLQSLPEVTLLIILCFTGDFVDGGIAQCSRHPRRSWVGDHDIQFDVFVAACLGMSLTGAGLVNWMAAVGYLIGWAIVFWRWGLEFNLMMLFQAPIYACFVWAALTFAPAEGCLLIIWIVVATAINWRRFTHKILPNFIQRMQSLWSGRNAPRSP